MGAQNAIRIHIMLFSILLNCSTVGLGILLNILAATIYDFLYIFLVYSFLSPLSLSLFWVRALLAYNLYIVQSTHLKYNSLVFGIFIKLCNHHYSQLLIIFITSKRNFVPFRCHLLGPQPWATINLLSVSIDLSILDI